MKMRRKTMLVVMTLLLAYGLQVVYVKSLPSEQITILGYHHIVEDKDKEAYFKGNMWVNSLSSFEAQMKLLKERDIIVLVYRMFMNGVWDEKS